MYSINLKIPFNTYIVIDEDSSSTNDFFYVYSYVENIFIKSLNKKTLMQNITLFLFAHRIAEPIQKLKNSFIFKTHDSDEEIATIEFDINNKKLIVTSLNKSYNNPNVDTAFRFELKDSNESKIKFSEIIPGNDNANNFKNTLNGSNFEIGDIINLAYENAQNVF